MTSRSDREQFKVKAISGALQRIEYNCKLQNRVRISPVLPLVPMLMKPVPKNATWK
jgi:hypothetical protein